MPFSPHVQVGDVAFRQGDDANAGKGQALEQARYVRLIAAQPVHGLGQHDVETAAPGVLHQLLNAGTKQRGARDCPVAVAVRDRPALPLGVQPAEPQLVLDGGVPLAVGGVAGVEDGSRHGLASAAGAWRPAALALLVLPRGLTRQQPDDPDQLRSGRR